MLPEHAVAVWVIKFLKYNPASIMLKYWIA